MSAPFQLRDYQREAIDSIYGWFENEVSNPLVVIPTGGGKAPSLNTFIKEALTSFPNTRILSVVHVQELVGQNYEDLINLWPEAPATICCAALGKRNLRGQIVCASIGSVYRAGSEVGWVDLIIIDETHLVPHKDEGMYKTLIADLRRFNPRLKVVGFTATPYRMTSGRLDEGEGAMFGGICYEIGIGELIKRGWLCPPVPKDAETKIDLSGLHTRNGELVNAELSERFDVDSVTQEAVDEMIHIGQAENRVAWLAFGVTSRHADHIAAAFMHRGIEAFSITDKTPAAVRRDRIAEYKRGNIKVLTCKEILTTGFNHPPVDLIGMMFKSKSPGKIVQVVGRGTRLSPRTGKMDCRCLDYGLNFEFHGPIDQITGRKKPSKSDGMPPMRQCPQCSIFVFAGVRVCPDCAYEFPPPGISIENTAGTAAILSEQVQPEWLPVTGVTYSRHEKPGKPPTLLVQYRTGLQSHKKWVFLEHGSKMREEACLWWKQAGGQYPPPNKVDNAIARQGELRVPTSIGVVPAGKYIEIRQVRFD